jgi:hypothetical protein
MAIDTSGKWWRGSSFADLAEYIRILTADSYPATHVVRSICICQNTIFRLTADQEEGCAQRTCTSCRKTAFIGDSADYWADATPRKVRCLCKNTTFEIGVGFALRDQRDVKWITVGQRCIKCGILGSYVDWKVDYSPSTHLLTLT